MSIAPLFRRSGVAKKRERRILLLAIFPGLLALLLYYRALGRTPASRATLAELAVRWSRLAALHHGRRARPSMRLHHRALSRTTAYAIRLGRAQYAEAPARRDGA